MKKEEIETLRKLTIIRNRLRCKHNIQADLCHLCQGKTANGKTVDEVIDEFEKSGFLKKVRSARKLGRIVGKTAFWIGVSMGTAGVSYVIYQVGRQIYAYMTKRKK